MHPRKGPPLKKALLLILGIVAVCFLIGNADYLATFVDTLQTGAFIPLVLAVILMLACPPASKAAS